MKKILFFILISLIPIFGCESSGDGGIYVCTGEGSYAYHCNKGCRGLNNCNGNIKSVSQTEAEWMNRVPCKICY